MDFNKLIFERKGDVTTITLNRPDRHNALAGCGKTVTRLTKLAWTSGSQFKVLGSREGIH